MGLGIALQLLPVESRDLILAGALISIALNPFVFAAVPAVERWIRSRPRLVALLEREGAAAPRDETSPALPGAGHAVVVGHGRVGSSITSVLEQERLPFVVVERDRPRYDALRGRGVPAVFGDATDPEILRASGVGAARLLIVATPDSYRARRVLELAEAANPGIQAVVRTHSEDELARLRKTVNGHVVMGERELARTMLLYVLRQFGVPPERARRLAGEPSSADLDAEAERR
ncbi:MAG: NAD-binding protein, partial [Rhodospirillaceae bacterium]